MTYDPLSGYPCEKEDPFVCQMWKVLAIVVLVASVIFLFILMVLTSGCITFAKGTAIGLMSTPTPTPTPIPTTIEPTPIPTPTPEPLPDWSCHGGNCYKLRDWLWWFRADANNFGEDLRVWTTVYDYKFLPAFKYYSVSWARNLKENPEPGKKFLFIFVNMYSDADDARPYLYPKEHWIAQVEDKLYYPEDIVDPSYRIVDLDDSWDYAHVQSPKPYGFKIKQEAGSGIITAEKQDTLYAGRSNAADGYIIYQVPEYADENNTKILARFGNQGEGVWELQQRITIE